VAALSLNFEVDQHWLHRLVRVEVDLDGDKIRIYRLRRREPVHPAEARATLTLTQVDV
jgi:hypothetical protein